MHIAHFLNLYEADMRLISCGWVTNDDFKIETINTVQALKHPSPDALTLNVHKSDATAPNT